MLISITACERDTYTSWKCQSAYAANIPMVLRKAQMEFKGSVFKYCGSLGNQSYFDQTCNDQTEKSNTVFSPTTGVLIHQSQEYQCVAL